MSGKPFLSGRIPEDLHKQIEKYCNEECVSKTEVMIEALRKYLDCPDPMQKSESLLETKIEQLEARLIRLERSSQMCNKTAQETNSNKTHQLQVGIEKVDTPINENVLLVANENHMGQESGATRSKLKRHREKIQAGKTNQNETVDGVINGKTCKIYLKGKEGKSWIWEARST